MPIIQLENVRKSYHLGKTLVPAIKGVSFSIDEGDFVSIIGPSGSGKSTILNMIGCIDVPTQGKVIINGQETSGLSDREITALRHDVIGFIFQSFNLLPVLNVYENIEFPFLIGKTRFTAQEKLEPKVVLADEPTANLDSKTGEDIIALMKKINKELKTTFIFSTHDHNIFSIADHVIRLKDGLVAEDFRQHAN